MDTCNDRDDVPLEVTPGTWTLELVTPDIAAAWLATQHDNRNINEPRVRTLAADMRAGRYVLTHQGVAIENGRLRDGQHRMRAIIGSGCPQRIWVYRYESTTPVMVIDRHQSRTDAQAMTISGRWCTSRDIAVITVMADGRTAFNGSRHRSPSEIAERFDRFAPEWMDAKPRWFAAVQRGITQAPIVGCLCRARMSLGREAVDSFIDCYTLRRQPVSLLEQNAARLRELAVASTKRQDGDARRDLYLKASAAVLAYVEGRPLKKLFARDSPDEPLPPKE